MSLNTIQLIAVSALPLVFAITVHEVAHGWVARRLGDPTAMMLGRLTLNPVKHIDPIGTIVVPAVLVLLGGFIFGWAKPVPVTWQNLKRPKRDMALVALAGPGANLMMALMWALIAKLGSVLPATLGWFAVPLQLMGSVGISFNVMLMVLNLLPLPPLDGGRVMTGILPGPWAYRFAGIEPYGFFILLALIATGVLTSIMMPPVQAFQHLIKTVTGL